jgi:hypothetical protein
VLQTGSATIMLEQLSGQYESIAVNGLTTTLNLHTAGADTLTMPAPARVMAEEAVREKNVPQDTCCRKRVGPDGCG